MQQLQKRKGIIGWYVVSDYVASAVAWYFLFLFRKTVIEGNHFHFSLPFSDNNFWVAMLIVPELWLLFHYLTGTYFDLYKKSRLQEVAKTFIVSFGGSVVIFFLLLLDDYVRSNRSTVASDSELQNLIDEIQQLIDSTLYKLRFLA